MQTARRCPKSLGNVVSPQSVMKTLGADIIRLWVAATDYRAEMSVSGRDPQSAPPMPTGASATPRASCWPISKASIRRSTRSKPATWSPWTVGRSAARRRLQQEIMQAYQDYNFHLIYQKLLNFCVADMGGFYLDVIKDRQYTTQADSLPPLLPDRDVPHRRGDGALDAPVLSFTADEIWGFMPGQRAESVFMETWYGELFALEHDALDADAWAQVIGVKTAVARQLEAMRKEGVIGSSLDAEVELYCDPKLADVLGRLGGELRFALITSYASVATLAQAPPRRVDTEVKGLGSQPGPVRTKMRALLAPSRRCRRHQPPPPGAVRALRRQRGGRRRDPAIRLSATARTG